MKQVVVLLLAVLGVLNAVNGQSGSLWSVYMDNGNWKLASGKVKNSIFTFVLLNMLLVSSLCII